MAKITLEKTDTIIKVSGPSSFLPLNAAVGSSNSQFKIVLDTATAGADLSKIGTAADNTTLVFFGKSTDYQVIYNAKTGIANVVNSTEKVIASLPIPKLPANNIRLNFDDYADATTVTLSKPVGTSKALVLSSQPDLAPTVTLSSSAAAVNEGSAVTYTATLNKVSATDLNIPYTLGGTATAVTDYTTTSTGTIKIVAGALTGTLVLTAVPDAKTEGAETITVTLDAVANVKLGVVTQSTTITDTPLTNSVNNIAVNATNAATVAPATTGVKDIYTMALGTYSATITNFDAANDKLSFGANVTAASISIENKADDGKATFVYVDGTNTETITITGLTSAQDTLLTTSTGLALILANTPAPSTNVNQIAVNATNAATIVAATTGVKDIYTMALGTYAATITNFDAANDKLSFGANVTAASISIENKADDGKATFVYVDGTNTETITITGLTSAQDTLLTTSTGLALILA